MVEKLIREETDPAELQRKLTAMIEKAYPARPFRNLEEMPFHEFAARFKRAYCNGSEPRFWQYRVMVEVDVEGNLALHFLRPEAPGGQGE